MSLIPRPSRSGCEAMYLVHFPYSWMTPCQSLSSSLAPLCSRFGCLYWPCPQASPGYRHGFRCNCSPLFCIQSCDATCFYIRSCDEKPGEAWGQGYVCSSLSLCNMSDCPQTSIVSGCELGNVPNFTPKGRKPWDEASF